MSSIGILKRPLRPVDYRWALDGTGRPIPIDLAVRGGQYTCPLCGGAMIARLGEQLQHHFSHDHLTTCTPQTVARAALRRWLYIHLTEALAARVRVEVRWRCGFCGQSHALNLLDGVLDVLETEKTHDIELVDAEGKLRGVFAIRDDAEGLGEFIARDLIVITIPLNATPMDAGIMRLISQGKVWGGPCTVLMQYPNLIRDPETIRRVLFKAASGPPGYFFGPIETLSGLFGVLRIGDRLVWLPPRQWLAVFGGTRNPIAPGVLVTIREWVLADGSAIYLYYVTIRETHAVGVRRYNPGVSPMLQLDGRFRRRQTTALDVARYLVMH